MTTVARPRRIYRRPYIPAPAVRLSGNLPFPHSFLRPRVSPDPIDGTTNFVHGFPVTCVSIGLVRGDEVRLLLGSLSRDKGREVARREKSGSDRCGLQVARGAFVSVSSVLCRVGRMKLPGWYNACLL